MLRTEGKKDFFNANKLVDNSSTLEMIIKSYILELLDLVTVFKMVYLQQSVKAEYKKNVNLLKKKKNLLHVSEGPRTWFKEIIWNSQLH